MASQVLDGRTDGRSRDFILFPMLCIALDRQKNKPSIQTHFASLLVKIIN